LALLPQAVSSYENLISLIKDFLIPPFMKKDFLIPPFMKWAKMEPFIDVRGLCVDIGVPHT
jgi:hypothetical protein